MLGDHLRLSMMLLQGRICCSSSSNSNSAAVSVSIA
ncbi:hypothetical protein A2U01_0098300, partial [Trifolium medium]|nr:hypothetical protein [Trifolium medium]